MEGLWNTNKKQWNLGADAWLIFHQASVLGYGPCCEVPSATRF